MAEPMQAPVMDWNTGDRMWDPRANDAAGHPNPQGDVDNIPNLGVAEARGNETSPVPGGHESSAIGINRHARCLPSEHV